MLRRITTDARVAGALPEVNGNLLVLVSKLHTPQAGLPILTPTTNRLSLGARTLIFHVEPKLLRLQLSIHKSKSGARYENKPVSALCRTKRKAKSNGEWGLPTLGTTAWIHS